MANRVRRVLPVTACLLALTACSDSTGHQPSHVMHPQMFVTPSLAPGQPCLGGVASSMERAQQDARIFLPNTQAYNKGTVSQVWRCASGAPLVEWKGLAIHFEDGWRDVDAEEAFREMNASNGVGTIVDVEGHAARYVPASGDVGPQLFVVLGDTMIQVEGAPSTSGDDLQAIANSLRPDA